MAGFLRGLGAAFSGAATGAAKAAVLEDERRVDLSKTVYADMVTQSDTFLERKQKILDEIDKEKQLVDSLAMIEVNGKPLTLVERQGLVRFAIANNYEKPAEVLKDFEMNTEEGARIINTKGATKKIATRTPQEDDSTLLFGSRTKAATEDALKLLKATGRDIDVTMPSRTSVEGVRFTRKPDTDVDFSDAYLVDTNGTPTEQVTVKRTYNKQSGTVDIEYLSKSTGKVVKPTKDQRVATSAEAFDKKAFIDFGPLVTITSDGGSEPMLDASGNIVYGYLMRNGEIRARRAGTISDEVITDALVAGKDWAPSIASGDLSEQRKFEKLPSVVDFSKEAQELRTAKQNNDLLFSRSQRRLDLHKKYGNRMYGPAGTFADFVTGTSKFVDGVVTIVNGLEELSNSDASLNEKIQFLESGGNIQELRSIVDQRDTFLDRYIGTAQEISMARVLDAALATVTAYDLAKQTGDTRISNNDFDQYIKTVSGNNAEQTVNLIKQGLESNLVIYTSKHETFTIAKESIPQYLDQKFLSDIDRRYNLYDTPRIYENRLKTMFKPFEEKQDEVRVIKTDDFEVMPVETDADGKQTRKVVMKDGTEFILRNPRFMDADKETIQQAIQKRLEAQAAAAQN